jgi:hypothetical protein
MMTTTPRGLGCRRGDVALVIFPDSTCALPNSDRSWSFKRTVPQLQGRRARSRSGSALARSAELFPQNPSQSRCVNRGRRMVEVFAERLVDQRLVAKA